MSAIVLPETVYRKYRAQAKAIAARIRAERELARREVDRALLGDWDAMTPAQASAAIRRVWRTPQRFSLFADGPTNLDIVGDEDEDGD